MSGICLLCNLDGAPVDLASLRGMVEAATYRGPDGTRTWHHGSAALAHLALHSTPESVAEVQPLISADGRWVLVADARIDNRSELIRELQDSGSLPEQAPTDAELILAAHACWGETCAARLVGDFAFAIWDTWHRTVFCARDHLGIKCLHWAKVGSTLLVASEAQQILAHPCVPRDLDETAMADYLVNRCEDEEHTMFLAVRRLPPAHCLVAGPKVRIERYWDADPGPVLAYRHDADYVAHFLDLFSRAVSDRLRTQGPTIGILMSGGADSTSIAAVAQRTLTAQGGAPSLLACSYAFETLVECDERIHSGLMSKELGIALEYFDIENDWLLRDREAFTPSLETPFLGWESAAGRVFERLAGRGARVVLTGHATWRARAGDASSTYLKRLLHGRTGVFKELAELARESRRPLSRLLARHLLGPLLPGLLRRVARPARATNSAPEIPSWIAPSFAVRTGLVERVAWRDPHPLAGGAVMRAVNWYDRTAPRFGLEARHPLLDRRLVAFLLAIPREQVFPPGRNRLILRRAMAGLVPDPVRLRRDKTKFFDFLALGLQDRERPRIEALLAEPVLGAMGIVDPALLRSAYDDYCSERVSRAEGSMLWFPISLEMWLREHGGGSRPETGRAHERAVPSARG